VNERKDLRKGDEMCTELFKRVLYHGIDLSLWGVYRKVNNMEVGELGLKRRVDISEQQGYLR
jgi:hypothetical protein